MIDTETWKIGTDCDKIEKLIKYYMHVQYHKKCLSEKERLSQVTANNPVFLYEW